MTKPKETTVSKKGKKKARKQAEADSFVWFLQQIKLAKTVAGINTAAGVFLQDLGIEPAE